MNCEQSRNSGGIIQGGEGYNNQNNYPNNRPDQQGYNPNNFNPQNYPNQGNQGKSGLINLNHNHN